MARPPIWKRKYVLEPRLQFEVTLYLTLYTIAALAAIYILVKKTLLEVFQQMAEMSPSCGPLLQDGKVNAATILNTAFVSNGLIVIAFAFVGGILISHRVVGPIFRFKQVIRQLTAGEDPGKIRVRKNDYFSDIIGLLENLKKERFSSKSHAIKEET